MSLTSTQNRVNAAQKDRNFLLMAIENISLNGIQQNLRVGSKSSSLKVTGRRANVTVVSSGAPLHVTANRGAHVTVLHHAGDLTIVSRGRATVTVLSIGGTVHVLGAGGDINIESLHSAIRGKVKSGHLVVCTGTDNVDVNGYYKKSKALLPQQSKA